MTYLQIIYQPHFHTNNLVSVGMILGSQRHIWNDQINAWIDYSDGSTRSKGEDGSYRIITALKEPKLRPNGDGLCNGDIWLNTCNFDIFYWEKQWIAFGNSGPGVNR